MQTLPEGATQQSHTSSIFYAYFNILNLDQPRERLHEIPRSLRALSERV